MVSIYDVKPRELIEAMAAELEKMPEMSPPGWAAYVKTGVGKERPPVEKNWWYVRAASTLRSVYRYGPIGVSKLKTKYSTRKNRGHAPDKVYKASGNIIRKMLQKLELVGLVKQTEVGNYKGRILTPKGESFVDKIVVSIKPKTGKKSAPKKEKKTEKKEIKKEGKAVDKKEEKKKEKKTEEKTKKKTGKKKSPEKNVKKKEDKKKKK